METITVIILPGGKKAKEVNPLKYPDVFEKGINLSIKRKAWKDREDKLRTFDIENLFTGSNGEPKTDQYGRTMVYGESTAHLTNGMRSLNENRVFEAQIINETKIRIV